jgi:hypothetical protein
LRLTLEACSLNLDCRSRVLSALSATSPPLIVDKLRLKPYISTAHPPDLSGRNSVVECQLPKLDVAGSTPVARSKLFKSNYKVPKSIRSADEKLWGKLRLKQWCETLRWTLIVAVQGDDTRQLSRRLG